MSEIERSRRLKGPVGDLAPHSHALSEDLRLGETLRVLGGDIIGVTVTEAGDLGGQAAAVGVDAGVIMTVPSSVVVVAAV